MKIHPTRRTRINQTISTRNLEADDEGIRFNVELDGLRLAAHVSYRRLLGRPVTREERALPPKYLFEREQGLVQKLVDEALADGSAGRSSLIIG